MKVLVTGGAGFIGSHLVEALRARGDEVRVLDNFDDAYDPAIKRARVSGEVVEGDVRDEAAVRRALAGVDSVFHLAARAGVRQSFADPGLYFDVNLEGTRTLTRLAGDIPLVHASSSSVYGVRRGEAFREDDALGPPASPYAASKREAEAVVTGAVVRLFTVYGPRQRPGMAFARFVAALRRGDPVTLYGDGGSIRDYTYVSDAVDGLLLALGHPGVYNVAGGQAVRLDEVIRTFGEVMGVVPRIVHQPEHVGDVPETRADLTRAGEVLGYAPRVALREGLSRMIAGTPAG